MKVQRYKHDSEYSYTLGATLTYEMLKCRPWIVTRVYICSETEITDGINEIFAACEKNGVPVEKNDKAFNILSPKGNCFVIGEFRKTEQRIEEGNHIVLVNPSDAGNLGTIIRTATGFGITNLAIIRTVKGFEDKGPAANRQAVDFYDPRTIRATMGAAFHVTVEYFDTIDDYMKRFPGNNRYAFMLQSSSPLPETLQKEPFSLVFGNEATGLPDYFADICTSVRIIHSSDIDSLNLPMAAGIAMYEFTKSFWQKK